MFQVNASLAIIMSFLITFVDEIGEIQELSMRKTVLIVIALIVGFLIYRYSNERDGNVEEKSENNYLNEKLSNNLVPLNTKANEGFKNYSNF